jgi:hypothetical protein
LPRKPFIEVRIPGINPGFPHAVIHRVGLHREIDSRALAGAEGEDHRPDDQSQNVGARHHHHPHPEQIDRAGHQIDMTFFHASGQQRDGEGAEQGNEGGDPGDNRRQLGIPDVIMEEVHQRPGLKEKGTPHQKDIAGEDHHGRLARRLIQARFRVMRSPVRVIFSSTLRKLTSRKKAASTPKITAV